MPKKEVKTQAIVTTGAKPVKAKKVEYAYAITDPIFGEFKVQKSANAWWLDKNKVEQLVQAFKIDSPLDEARIWAGITRGQWEYFVKVHPEFYGIIEALRQVPMMKARRTAVGLLETDSTTVRWYLERKAAKEFGPKMPQVAVQINIGEDRKSYG